MGSLSRGRDRCRSKITLHDLRILTSVPTNLNDVPRSLLRYYAIVAIRPPESLKLSIKGTKFALAEQNHSRFPHQETSAHGTHKK